jgi:hypothetical protein
MTVTTYAIWGAAICGASAIDTWIASIASEAMKRADLTQDYISRVTRIPAARLSDQLSGKLPFTGFVRFGCREIRENTFFWTAFVEVLADRVDRAVVPVDVARLVAGVEELVGQKRRMARMSLDQPDAQKREAM